MTPHPIQGIHHVTAITADAQRNLDFYTRTLGLRLVKLTINYDDPSSYHLYYGDGRGSPGTILTFFAWPGRRGTTGTGQTQETAFAIPQGSAAWWTRRLHAQGGQQLSRFGETAVTFRDPDGLELALVETPSADPRHAWTSAEVPADHAIRGFHGVTLQETDPRLPASVLVDHFGYRLAAQDATRTRYQAAGSPGAFVDVVVPAVPRMAHGGTGTVHHVAFRAADDPQQAAWLDLLRRQGHHVSPVMDRDYFHSIYFREPGGVLFEIATDGPGFGINEETPGSRLMLPAWLEDQRAEIEAGLPALTLPVQAALESIP